MSLSSAGGENTRLKRYEDALEHFKAGRREESYRILSELWEQQRSFDVAMALGGLELARREYALAAYHFHFARENLPPSFAPAHGEKIEAGFGLAWNHVGALDVEFLPRDAELRIDGRPAEQPLYLMPGEYELSVSREGYEAYVETVSIFASQRSAIRVSLRETAPISGKFAAGPDRPRWTLLLVGGVTTAVLGGLAIHSFSEAATAQRQVETCIAGSCSDTARIIDRRDEHRDAGLVWGGVAVGAGTVTATLWWLWPEANEGPTERAFFQRLVNGTTPGQASWPKLTTALTLHAASLAGIGLGTWQLVDADNERSKLGEQRGTCNRALESMACLDTHLKMGETHAQSQLGTLLLVGGVLAHLAALGVAEYWPNMNPQISLDERSVSVGARLAF